jgi:hypothetical protein
MSGIEHILGKQTPTSKAAKGIKRLAYNSLVIRYLMIDYLKEKWVQEIAASNRPELACRNEILLANEKFQREISQVFSPCRHLCQRCQYCCQIDLPFYRIDCILYGWRPNDGLMVAPKSLIYILKKTIPLPLRIFLREHLYRSKPEEKELTPSEATTQFPCSFWTDKGCTFALGRRPTFCVLYLCEYFMFEMSWRDFTRYIRLGHQYLHHLSRSLRLILTECRRQHPG